MDKRYTLPTVMIVSGFLLLFGLSIFNAFNLVQKINSVHTAEPVTNLEMPESPVSYATITEIVNVKRAENGVKPALMSSVTLNKSAQYKANDMTTQDYWAHNSPNGTEPWKFFDLAGYKYIKAGENLAKCYTTPESIVDAWYASPTHRENLLGDYDEVGYGVGTMRNGCLVIVQHLGRI